MAWDGLLVLAIGDYGVHPKHKHHTTGILWSAVLTLAAFDEVLMSAMISIAFGINPLVDFLAVLKLFGRRLRSGHRAQASSCRDESNRLDGGIRCDIDRGNKIETRFIY